MDAQKFGAFVAAVRKEKHMTQAELASKIQVSDKAVSRWERGLGFPDINTLEPLADALGIGVLELVKSEKIETQEIQYKEAEVVLADTIKAADNQRRLERKQERKFIVITVGIIVLLSLFTVLMDNLGWSVQNVVFTSIGVILPIVCLIAVAVFVIIGIIRRIMGKPCKQIWITIFIFAAVLILFFFAFLYWDYLLFRDSNVR